MPTPRPGSRPHALATMKPRAQSLRQCLRDGVASFEEHRARDPRGHGRPEHALAYLSGWVRGADPVLSDAFLRLAEHAKP